MADDGHIILDATGRRIIRDDGSLDICEECCTIYKLTPCVAPIYELDPCSQCGGDCSDCPDAKPEDVVLTYDVSYDLEYCRDCGGHAPYESFHISPFSDSGSVILFCSIWEWIYWPYKYPRYSSCKWGNASGIRNTAPDRIIASGELERASYKEYGNNCYYYPSYFDFWNYVQFYPTLLREDGYWKLSVRMSYPCGSTLGYEGVLYTDSCMEGGTFTQTDGVLSGSFTIEPRHSNRCPGGEDIYTQDEDAKFSGGAIKYTTDDLSEYVGEYIQRDEDGAWYYIEVADGSPTVDVTVIDNDVSCPDDKYNQYDGKVVTLQVGEDIVCFNMDVDGGSSSPESDGEVTILNVYDICVDCCRDI